MLFLKFDMPHVDPPSRAPFLLRVGEGHCVKYMCPKIGDCQGESLGGV